MIAFIKKNKWNLLFLLFFALYIIPQTGMPIKVFIQRMLAFSPSEVAADEQQVLTDYQWRLRSLDNETVSFTASEGKVIVVNFWATWCPPCVAEMPSLQKLYDHYGDRVDFYLVTSETPEIVHNFIASKGYSFPVYLEESAPPAMLETRELPTTYLITKDGTIVINKKGVAQWDSDSVKETIETLLKD